MTNAADRASRQSGQILVLFTVAAVAVIGMVGLVLDGGSTFVQRRDQQNASDAASLAAANSYLLMTSETTATAAARTAAAANGFTDAVGGVTVGVAYDYSDGVSVTVSIRAPHANAFTPVLGIASWTVSTTSTAQAGFPDTAIAAAPFIGNIHIFDSDGNPAAQYSDPNNPYGFGEGNGDIPTSAGDIAWTNYGVGNVDTTEVQDIIKGTEVVTSTLDFGQYIGQANSGNHTPLYDLVNQYMSGVDIPVPIVDDNGNFQGWAEFHIVSAGGSSTKTISGYYRKGFTGANVTLTTCAFGTCPRYLGSYVLKLTN